MLENKTSIYQSRNSFNVILCLPDQVTGNKRLWRCSCQFFSHWVVKTQCGKNSLYSITAYKTPNYGRSRCTEVPSRKHPILGGYWEYVPQDRGFVRRSCLSGSYFSRMEDGGNVIILQKRSNRFNQMSARSFSQIVSIYFYEVILQQRFATV